MFYFATQEVSLFDLNPSSYRLEFVGVCGYCVFLETLVQPWIAITVKDSALPRLAIFRELDLLYTVSFESYTITSHNNGKLFGVVFTDNDECRLSSIAPSGRSTSTSTSSRAARR